MIRACLIALLLAGALPSLAQDYGREKRWSDEVVPGLVVGDPVWLAGPGAHKFLGLYAEAGTARGTVLLVHGIGVHPDHGVIGSLRTSLADAGYNTLSIQMPVLAADAAPKDYAALFPDAVARIRSAAAWLAAKGGGPLVLASHSLGSAMSGAYYQDTPGSPFAAWVCMGLGGAYPSMRNVRGPVLDIFGEHDLPSVLRADWRRRMAVDSIPGSRQLRIAGADHFYAGREKQLAAGIDAFIREQVLK
jgi:pimeloyl-ACP methyl ester carboxylesterase